MNLTLLPGKTTFLMGHLVGQRQRIAVARAHLKRPKLLIFDEAISNLDQQTAEHFAQTVNRLKGRAGCRWMK